MMRFKLKTVIDRFNFQRLGITLVWEKVSRRYHADTLVGYLVFRDGKWIYHSKSRPATQDWRSNDTFINGWEWIENSKTIRIFRKGATHYFHDDLPYLSINSETDFSRYGVVYYGGGTNTQSEGNKIPFEDIRSLMGWPEWYTNTTDEIMRDFTEGEKMLYLLTYR